MLYNRVGSETQRPWKCFLCYTTGREITIREATEWIPGTTEDAIWVIKKTVYGLKDSNRAFYNVLKKTILSFVLQKKRKKKAKKKPYERF